MAPVPVESVKSTAMRPRFTALPYAGMQTFPLGGRSGIAGRGWRVGALAGVRLEERFSVDGEVTYDAVGFERSGADNHETMWAVTVGGLAHLPAGPMAVVVGPRVGLFRDRADAIDRVDGERVAVTRWKPVLGWSAGGFVPVSRFFAPGLVLAAEIRRGDANPCLAAASRACPGVVGTAVVLVSAAVGVLF